VNQNISMPDTYPLGDWTSDSAHKETEGEEICWRGCTKDYVVILIERIVKSALFSSWRLTAGALGWRPTLTAHWITTTHNPPQ